MKKAIITGITGQDGSYLAELLLNKGYEVHGFIRRTSSRNTERIEHILNRVTLHYADLTDCSCIYRIIDQVRPDEVYNLAAQSHVGVSFDDPIYTAEADAVGVLNILEAIRKIDSGIRFYQASTSELFGQVQEVPQRETTPFYPRSPYGVAKLYAYWITRNYREAYGIFACNGILFNHESPRRGENFVTRKVTLAAARIKAGLQRRLVLGDLDTTRDWGYAGDYVEGMWRMLQADRPDDYVLATGEEHTIRELCETAFARVGLDWRDYVDYDEKFVRPSEVPHLLGDASKARTELGWTPGTDFRSLVEMMVDSDMKLVAGERTGADE